MLESIFLGVFIYGRRYVSPGLYAFSAVAVWLGSWLSGFFIVATNAWMQHPVGYAIASDGEIELRSISAVLLSKFAWWQYSHVMTGAVVAGAFIVAGIAAYYLLSRRDQETARRMLRAGVIVGALACLVIVFPTGDQNGDDVTRTQPAKLAAMEGIFASEQGAPLAIFGIPDTQHKSLIDPVYVPDLLSFLAYGNFRANVKGLDGYAVGLRPPVELTYYAYHVMVGLGTIFVAIMVVAATLLATGVLYGARWMLWILMLGIPFPYIANEAGWMTSEVGRQPWIIYGIMRTTQGASPNVVAGQAIFTTIGFAGMYFLLGTLFLLLTLRTISEGVS
jgi:cytochrome bd ubiquinol oxidase subunit I